MNKMLKPLAVAATLIAMLAPAKAEQARMNTSDPAYRIMVTGTLYTTLEIGCRNVDLARARALTVAIVDKAQSEAPSMNVNYLVSKWQPLNMAYGGVDKASCQAYFQNLVDITNGVVFE
jgi:hypothetical protein